MSKNQLIVVTLLVIISIGYGYKYLFNKSIVHNVKVENCKIKESKCSVELAPGKSLIINILPRGMPQTEEMTIDVFVDGFEADDITLDFEGIEIDHNLPTYPFKQISEKHFNTKGFISLCTLRSMNWLAHLVVFENNESWKISFPFRTTRVMNLVD